MSAFDEMGSSLSSAIQSRRSVRRFDPQAVSPVILETIIRQACWAPSPHNSQPWRFTNLRPEAKSRLARAMADRLRTELEDADVGAAEIDRQVTRSVDRIDQAPAALVCSIVADGLHLTGQPRHDDLEMLMAIQSVGSVMQSVFLVAREYGLGTCWMAAPMYCPDTVRQVLDLPSEYYPQALVLAGNPADQGRVRPRLPFERVYSTR